MRDLSRGVGVEVNSDGSSGLAFETPFHALDLAEMLYDSARRSLLLLPVAVIDGNDPRHGQTGYINAIERDTLHVKFFVTFPENGERRESEKNEESGVTQLYSAGQLTFERKDSNQPLQAD